VPLNTYLSQISAYTFLDMNIKVFNLNSDISAGAYILHALTFSMNGFYKFDRNYLTKILITNQQNYSFSGRKQQLFLLFFFELLLIHNQNNKNNFIYFVPSLKIALQCQWRKSFWNQICQAKIRLTLCNMSVVCRRLNHRYLLKMKFNSSIPTSPTGNFMCISRFSYP